MAIRFAIERVERNRALSRAYAFSLAFGTGTLLLLSSGCRSPWSAQANQPSFDRLMEIENSSATMPPSFQSPVNGRRPMNGQQSNFAPANPQTSKMEQMSPGESSESPYARYAQKPNGVASRRISDMDEYVDDDVAGVSKDKQQLLKSMQRALQEAENNSDESNHLANNQSARKNTSSPKKANKSGSSDRYSVHIGDDDEEQGLKPADNLLALRPVPGKQTDQKTSARKSSEGQRRSESSDEEYIATASHNRKDKEDSVRSAVAETMVDIESAESLLPKTVKELTWEQHIQQAIKQLESAEDDSLETPQSKLRQQVLTRVLALTLADRQAMLKSIEGLQAGEQDYFSYQFSALADAIDPDANPSASRKWSTVMINQRKAHSSLASISNLEINNLTFCKDVVDFGVVEPFPTNAFKASQEVLLYLELDNFVSEKARDGKGFETQLQGSYEIVEAGGRRIMEQTLPSDSHVCKNVRRDYFIAYRIYLPEKINPGTYTLKVTIEDVKGHKFGQKEIQFQIQ